MGRLEGNREGLFPAQWDVMNGTFNVGYLRRTGPNSRIGIDYQSKNDVTFNDDELNNQLSITWNALY